MNKTLIKRLACCKITENIDFLLYPLNSVHGSGSSSQVVGH